MTQPTELNGVLTLHRHDPFTIHWTYAGSSVLPLTAGSLISDLEIKGWLIDEGPRWMRCLLLEQLAGQSLEDTVAALKVHLSNCEAWATRNDQEIAPVLMRHNP